MRVSARSIAALGAVGLALGNVARIPAGALGGRNSPIVVADLIILVVWLVLFIQLIVRRGKLVLDGVNGAVLGFVVVASISTYLSFGRYGLGGTEKLGVLAFLIRWIVYFGWYPFVARCLGDDDSREAWKYIERALLVFAAFGLFQSVFLPGFAQMVHAGGDQVQWDRQGARLVSTLLDPNFAGIVIVIALLFRLARVAEGIQTRALPMLVFAAAIVLTLSRSAIAALLIGIVVIVAARGLRGRLMGMIVGSAFLILPFVSILLSFADRFHKLSYDASAAQRLVPWTRALALVNEHPLLGVGFNAIKPAQEAHYWALIGGADVSLDGGLLFVAAMTGVLGLFFYLLLLSRVVRASRQAWRDPKLESEDRAHAVATAAATIAVVAHSFFVNSLLLPFVMQILWVMWGRLSHITARRRSRLSVAAVAPLVLAAATACEPCAGTSNCSTAPRVVLNGQIVHFSDGNPVAKVELDATFTERGGTPQKVVAFTDEKGLWELRFSPVSNKPVDVQITVTAGALPPYHVPVFTVDPTTSGGEAKVFGPWTDQPYARFEATVVRRGVPLAGATVHFFAQTGTPLTYGLVDAVTNGSGIFLMDFVGLDVGATLGQLRVTLPGVLSKPSFLDGVSIPLDYHFTIPTPAATYSVGGSLTYGGEVIFRGTGEHVPNATVQFTRTGGIDVNPTVARVVSNKDGFFVLDLDPATDGEVIGDLTIFPPFGATATYKNVKLATYDSVALRTSGLWAFGEKWAWAVELWRNDSLKPAPNIPVQFVRTGGIALTPETISGVTASNGRFELRGTTRDTGFVDGKIVVSPPGGAPKTITGIHLRTNADDALHFAGVFGYGPAIRYVGEVHLPNETPVAGAQVTWTQTSGISATPATLTGTTGADGRFPLTLYPSGDGVAVGTIRIRPPAPWAPGTEFVFTNLQLATFEGSELRLAITYRIPPP